MDDQEYCLLLLLDNLVTNSLQTFRINEGLNQLGRTCMGFANVNV